MTSKNRRIATAVAVTLALGTAPAAEARPDVVGGGYTAIERTVPVPDVANGGHTAIDRTAPAPDATSAGYGTSVPQPTVVQVEASPSSFDWSDAAIGAGAAFGLTMVGVGGMLATGRRRQRQPAVAG